MLLSDLKVVDSESEFAMELVMSVTPSSSCLSSSMSLRLGEAVAVGKTTRARRDEAEWVYA